MGQGKRRGALRPRLVATICVKDVVGKRTQNERASSDCRWAFKRAFKVGGIVTHPRVPGDASVAFSAQRDASMGNK